MAYDIPVGSGGGLAIHAINNTNRSSSSKQHGDKRGPKRSTFKYKDQDGAQRFVEDSPA